jgi:hypothetical protein
LGKAQHECDAKVSLASKNKIFVVPSHHDVLVKGIRGIALDYKCSRRTFIDHLFGLIALASASGFHRAFAQAPGIILIDAHSQLQSCAPSEIVLLRSFAQALSNINRIRKQEDGHLAICGAQHAGGGQQFATGAPVLDATGLNKILHLNEQAALLSVEAGCRWPTLISWLQHRDSPLTFTQKQTGNDNLTIGGTLSANAHGQGLKFPPIISDVESFEIVLADGSRKHCSRSENTLLFRLAIGGYGNFGLITRATLRLRKRLKYRCKIQPATVADIPHLYHAAVEGGAIYGDFQSLIDETQPGFLQSGFWKAYYPVDDSVPITTINKLSDEQWQDLVSLAHADKTKAWSVFSTNLMKLNGAVNTPELWQSSPYVLNYHSSIDGLMHAPVKGSELLTELYVPLKDADAFMADARRIFIANKSNMIYSTIRFVEKDDESFLPWARTLSACIIFNIHTDHSDAGKKLTEKTCRDLIDAAIKYGGRYYLTYHRYATKEQVLACYPEFPEFLKLKKQFDPHELFRSDWYIHYRDMFAS